MRQGRLEYESYWICVCEPWTIISGAMYSEVPHIVCDFSLSSICFAKPKSVRHTCPTSCPSIASKGDTSPRTAQSTTLDTSMKSKGCVQKEISYHHHRAEHFQAWDLDRWRPCYEGARELEQFLRSKGERLPQWIGAGSADGRTVLRLGSSPGQGTASL